MSKLLLDGALITINETERSDTFKITDKASGEFWYGHSDGGSSIEEELFESPQEQEWLNFIARRM